MFDDIQWGEETFLDLVEHVALLSSGAPLLSALHGPPGAARPPPLLAGDGAARAAQRRGRGSLIGAAVPEELRERIATAAGGNPLFIGEMLAMAGEGGERGRGAADA